MPRDVFNRITDAYGGSFSADGAYISFSVPGLLGHGAGLNAIRNDPGVGLLTQNLNINYRQNILRLYEIGTNYHFFVAGRTAGQMGIQRVLGPRPVSIEFYRKFADVCNVASNVFDLTMATGCTNVREFGGRRGAEMTLRIMYLVIDSLAVNIGAQDSLINENLSAMFASLNWVDQQNANAALEARNNQPLVVVGGGNSSRSSSGSSGSSGSGASGSSAVTRGVSAAADSAQAAASNLVNNIRRVFGGGSVAGDGTVAGGTADESQEVIPPMPPAGPDGAGGDVPADEIIPPMPPVDVPTPDPDVDPDAVTENQENFSLEDLPGPGPGGLGLTGGLSNAVVASYVGSLYNWLVNVAASLTVQVAGPPGFIAAGERANRFVASLQGIPLTLDGFVSYRDPVRQVYTELVSFLAQSRASNDALRVQEFSHLLRSFPQEVWNTLVALS